MPTLEERKSLRGQRNLVGHGQEAKHYINERKEAKLKLEGARSEQLKERGSDE